MKEIVASIFELTKTSSAPKAFINNVLSAALLLTFVVLTGFTYYRVTETYNDIEQRRADAAPLVARMVEANAFAVDDVAGAVLTGVSEKPRRSSYLFAEMDGIEYSCGFNPGTGVVDSCSPVAAN